MRVDYMILCVLVGMLVVLVYFVFGCLNLVATVAHLFCGGLRWASIRMFCLCITFVVFVCLPIDYFFCLFCDLRYPLYEFFGWLVYVVFCVVACVLCCLRLN